jgi:hypothetical protein
MEVKNVDGTATGMDEPVDPSDESPGNFNIRSCF